MKIWAELSCVLSQCTRLIERQTTDSFLMARLHCTHFSDSDISGYQVNTNAKYIKCH